MAWLLAMAKKALLQAKSITATTSQQTVSPDNGYDGLSSVTVKPQVHTATYTASTKNAALDMGAQHNNRYVDTSGIANSNSGTYTFASGDTGGTKDMGETNSYRYVNAANVYAKGKADGSPSTLVNKAASHSDAGNDQKDVTISGFTVGSLVLWAIRMDETNRPTFTGATVLSNAIGVGTTYNSTVGIYLLKATSTSIRCQIGYANGYSVAVLS